MKTTLLLVALTASLSLSAFASQTNGDDCNYHNDGGYNSRDCHVLNEERLDDLEARQGEVTTALNNGSLRGETGSTGATGQTGAIGQKGDQGVAGQDGTNGTDGRNGLDGVNGTNGRDGIVDPDLLQTVLDGIRQNQVGIAQTAAMSMISQAPHGQSSLSVACGTFVNETECVVGGSLYLDDANLLINFSAGNNIAAGGITYHFGH